MRRTRRSRSALSAGRAGFVAAAAVVLAACSGGGSPTASASSGSAAASTPAPSSATPAGPTGADAVFCQQVSRLITQLTTVQAAPPEQLPALLRQLVANVDGVHPPAALRADWQALGDELHHLQSAVASVDVTTPQGQAELQRLEAQATASAAAPQGTISAWVLSNCSTGVTVTSSSATSTS